MVSLEFRYKKIFLLLMAMMLAGPSPTWAKESQDAVMMQKVRRHIEQNMIWPVDCVRIEFLSAMPRMDDLKGKVTCNIESKPREEYIGDTSFTIRLFADGIFAREENVRVRIEVLRDFVVSVNNIAKDSVLQASDVALQKKWVRSIPMNTVSSLEEAVGKSLIVSIRPHTTITRLMLKDVLPVRKGKMVQVVLDNGVMRMMMNGIAEEDGAEDALVRIRNISSNKIIHARVIGQGKVQVDF
jgi:flagella basal body P-ring formation protein FlgA